MSRTNDHSSDDEPDNGGGGSAPAAKQSDARGKWRWERVTVAVIGLLTALASSGAVGFAVEQRSHPHDLEAWRDSTAGWRDSARALSDALTRSRRRAETLAGSVEEHRARAERLERAADRTRRTLDAILAGSPAGPADTAIVRFHLDTVRVAEDGEAGTARWAVAMNVHDRRRITMPVRYFNDDDGAAPISRSTLLRAPVTGSLRIEVTAERGGLVLRETDSVRVPARGETIRRTLPLAASDRGDGSFVFIYRIERIG